MATGAPSPNAEPLSPAHMIGTWVVCEVYSRHEKRLADTLGRARIQHCLPLEAVRVKDACGKPRNVVRPILPGYVFVCCRCEDDWYELASRRSIYGLIRIPSGAQRQFVAEITSFWRTAQSGHPINRHPFATTGRLYKIARGPLATDQQGIEGIVVSRDDGKHELVLQCTLLGQSIAIEVDLDDVEPL